MGNNNEGIQTKVGVKGDKEYKAALQQISRQLTVLNTDMKASQSAFGNQADSMDGMHDRLEKLNEIYEVQAKKVELIREHRYMKYKKDAGQGVPSGASAAGSGMPSAARRCFTASMM